MIINNSYNRFKNLKFVTYTLYVIFLKSYAIFAYKLSLNTESNNIYKNVIIWVTLYFFCIINWGFMANWPEKSENVLQILSVL